MDIYLVGGAVRDQLLGLTPTERDWVVVGGDRMALLELGYQPVGKHFPVYLHPKTHEEYALARTEKAVGRGHQDFTFEIENVTLEDDLLRRDLTINAIAQDDQGQLIDPYGGQDDLNRKLFRHVSEAFAEDPLRVLRVARFSAKFPEFTVAPETDALMRQMVEDYQLEELSAERLWGEIEKALMYPAPWRFFEVINHVGAYSKLFKDMQHLCHFDKVLHEICELSDEPAVRLAAGFWGVGAIDIKALKSRLALPNRAVDLIDMVARHGKLWQKSAPVLAEDWLTLLENLDVVRRPDRAQMFAHVALANGMPAESVMCLRACTDLVCEVTASDVTSDVKGEAMGRAIRELRLNEIDKYLLGKLDS